MERSKGLILIVVGIAAALIVWQVGSKKTEAPTPSSKIGAEGNPETPSQPAAGTASRQNTTQPDRFTANAPGRNPVGTTSADRNQGRDNITDRVRTTPTNIQNTGYKIAIPANISSAELQVIYGEYRQMTGGRNTGRTRGNRGGGMMEGGRGGMDMMNGGFGGMGGMDMENMMNMMNGGFGGGMGGMGMGMAPGGDFGGMGMEGTDMGDNEQMNIDDSENNL